VASVKLVRNGVEKTITVKLDALPGDIAQTGSSQSPSAQLPSGALDGVKASDLNENLRQRFQIPVDIKGAVVTNIDENSIAANAGLQQNDIILEINRHVVAAANDVTNLVTQATGPRILLKLWRSEGSSTGVLFLSVDNAKRAK
jgi:serine protease Do